MNNLIISTMTALALPILVYGLAWILASRQMYSSREKMTPYECGFDPNHTARVPFSLRFFLLAIIFVVFDIEIVLLIPLPMLAVGTHLTYVYTSSLVFLTILLLGLFHEWNQGSLDWSN